MRAGACGAAALGLLLCALTATAGPRPVTADLKRLVRGVGERVEQLRGLRFLREVDVEVVSDAQARAYFKERARQLWPEERLRLDERVYVQLGLLDEGTDLLTALLDLLEEQVAAYYDPEGDTFFVLDDMPPALAPVFMAHELTHALDDQHFALEKLQAGAREDDDRSAAVAAVIEGSGTLVMSLYMQEEAAAGRLPRDAFTQMQQTDAGRAEKLKAAPPLLQRSLMAPYALGLSFVLRGELARIRGGVLSADLDRAFTNPPHTSEQILHPEQYWGASPALQGPALTLSDLSSRLGRGWRLAARGSLGEINLAILTGGVTPNLGSPEAAEPWRWTTPAATGNDGDVYHHYVSAERKVTLLATRWDDAREATEFGASVRALPTRRVFRYDRGVVVLAGDYGDRADWLAGAALGEVAAQAGTQRDSGLLLPRGLR